MLLFFCQPSYAQLLMEKSKVQLTVDPGDTIVDSIALHNTSERPMELTIYWEDFEYLPPFDGKKKFMPAGTSPYSMAHWISYSPQEVTIPPQSKKDINFTIKVPRSATGGHYGVFFFEQGSRAKSDVTGVTIVTRLGSLFFIETAGKNKTSSLKDLTADGNRLEGIFVNQGDVILFPEGIYYIMDKEGLVSERGELDKIYLPPAQEAAFGLDVPNSLKAGEYTLVLTFDLGDGYSVVKEVDFRMNTDSTFDILQQRD